jgi:hypothetical protein
VGTRAWEDELWASEMERVMKIQDLLLKAMAKKITWWTADEIIGVSDRTMWRWRERAGETGSFYFALTIRRRQLRKMSAIARGLFRSSVSASNRRTSKGSSACSARRRRRARSNSTKRPTSSFSCGAKLS